MTDNAALFTTTSVGSQNPLGLATTDILKFDSFAVSVLVVFLLSLVPILTISGNCLVVWAILTQKSLQQVQNRLLISLAVADILVAVTVMPFAIFTEIAAIWPFGFVLCDIWRTMDVMCCTSSILHLCAIALDRYWAITSPFTYAGRRTKKLMLTIIAVVWTSSLVISLPPVTIWHGEGHGKDGKGCELIVDPVYIVYSAVGSFYGPLAAMLVIYVRIYQVAAERLRAKSERRSKYSSLGPGQKLSVPANLNTSQVAKKVSLQPSCSMMDVPNGAEGSMLNIATSSKMTTSLSFYDVKNGTPSPNEDTKNPPSTPQSPFRSRLKIPLISVTVERKAANTLGVILGCFVSSWLPFFTLYILSPFVPQIRNLPYMVTSVVTWLGFFNSMVNPIIYTIFNPDFRTAFAKIFKFLDTTKSASSVQSQTTKRQVMSAQQRKEKRLAHLETIA